VLIIVLRNWNFRGGLNELSISDESIHTMVNLMFYDLRAGLRLYRTTLVDEQLAVCLTITFFFFIYLNLFESLLICSLHY
jgi:hypothetical protein